MKTSNTSTIKIRRFTFLNPKIFSIKKSLRGFFILKNFRVMDDFLHSGIKNLMFHQVSDAENFAKIIERVRPS